MAVHKIKIWDLPLRVFHWALVIAIIASYITAQVGGDLTLWHSRLGAFALALLVFRLSWGFIGSFHARFVNFFPTPSRLKHFLQGNWQAHGHNPLGALSVFALLAVLATLVATGLFGNDDITFQGPLFSLVDKERSDWLTGLHKSAFDVLLVLIVLHLLAIAFYLLVKKNNLVKPMLTGSHQVVSDESLPAESTADKSAISSLLRFLIAVAIAATIVGAIFSDTVVKYVAPAVPAPATSSAYKW